MKLLLVIDIVDDVVEAYEDFTVDYDLRGTPIEDRTVNESIKYIEGAEPRPLPPRMENMRNTDDIKEKYRDIGYCDGWNGCRDAIANHIGKSTEKFCNDDLYESWMFFDEGETE